MSVAATRTTGQYAERPGGNRGELNGNQSALRAVQRNGKRDCPHFAHALGRSKRDVPMAQNDNAFQGRSPSGWHDSARGRDAGHDEMQVEVYEHFRAQLNEPKRTSYKGKDYVLRQVLMENPLLRGNMIIAWCDIIRVWRNEKNLDEWTSGMIHVYEIKPIIYSIGAVIRQCKALQLTAEVSFADRHGNCPTIMVVPIVKADDPKLSLLRRAYFALAWDGNDLSDGEAAS